MKNVLFNITLPTTRQLGGPLTPAEIRGFVLAISGDGGANWTPVGTEFTPDIASVPVNDLAFGDQYQVRGIVFDTADQPSNPTIVPFTIADDSPPGELVIDVAIT